MPRLKDWNENDLNVEQKKYMMKLLMALEEK